MAKQDGGVSIPRGPVSVIKGVVQSTSARRTQIMLRHQLDREAAERQKAEQRVDEIAAAHPLPDGLGELHGTFDPRNEEVIDLVALEHDDSANAHGGDVLGHWAR